VKTELENEKMKNHNSTRRLAFGIDSVTPEVVPVRQSTLSRQCLAAAEPLAQAPGPPS
jgi:hypothetical protein